MTDLIRAAIDGDTVEVESGTTILDALRAMGGSLPTLCHSPDLKPFGACRLCLVEVEGGKPVAACHTPVLEGASYTTHSDRLTRIRRGILELIVSDHPLNCMTCKAAGACELQAACRALGVTGHRYETPRTHDPEPDRSHPFVHLNMTKCIGCARCVRACDEIQGSFVLGMAGRGYDVRVIAGDETGLDAAGCASCGQCAIECPTEAIRDGGRLWEPDTAVNTTCVYCGVGCSLIAFAQNGKVVSILPDPDGPANRGHACVKGRFGHAFVHAPDRLTTPLIRGEDGEFREADWNEAVNLVASRFKDIRDEHGGQAFGMISSSRCANEENYLAQKFTRMVMGTNSVDNCARVCHSPSAFALGQSLGTGASTTSFEDVERSDVIMVVGANPTEAHPVLGSRIKQAVFAGAKLIVLDPRNTELARLADIHLALRPGSNVAVINAMQKVLIDEGLIDQAFIDAHSEGFDEVAKTLESVNLDWASEISGVDPDAIRAAARLYATGRAAQILWGLGITEACHGTVAAFGLINMAVMTGNVGREGAGCGPIRGQNNVQGACDMGALPNVFSDYRPVADAAARADHERVWGAAPPATVGFKIPEMYDAARAGSLKALYVLAQDVAQSDPDVASVNAALDNLEFLVVQDLFLSETAKKADVILPGASFLEKDGTFTNSDRRVQRIRKAIEPVAGYADGDVIHLIARRMGVDMGLDDGEGMPVNPARVMKEIASLTPKWGGVEYGRLEEKGFLQWPCPDSEHPGTPIVHKDGAFLRGRARLTPTPWEPPADEPDADYPFLLTTGRMLFHYNVGTMTRRTPIKELSRARNERVRIHPVDASRLGVGEGEDVVVASKHGRITAPAEITDETPPGVVFMTFHFPETRTNLLVGPESDAHTQCPEYKVTAVRVEAA